MQMLMRFYDPNLFVPELLKPDRAPEKYLLHGNVAGCVKVNDGYDLRRSVDLHSWRDIIGYVGQEPVLFDMSAWDNLIYGLPGDKQDSVTVEEVAEAARMAKCDFLGPVTAPPEPTPEQIAL